MTVDTQDKPAASCPFGSPLPAQVIPFPSEALFVPERPNRVVLYFEYDGHCYVMASKHWKLWIRYIVSTAVAFDRPHAVQQCRSAFDSLVSSRPW